MGDLRGASRLRDPRLVMRSLAAILRKIADRLDPQPPQPTTWYALTPTTTGNPAEVTWTFGSDAAR